MIHPENDLENILEMEIQEQFEEPELYPMDQYSLDKECQTYRIVEEHREIEQAINMVQEPPQKERPADPLIIPVEDPMEVIELPDNEPKIIRYLNEP